MPDMVKTAHCDEVDFSDWNFASLDLSAHIAQEATEAVKNTLRDSPPYISLPWIWQPDSDGFNGPAVADPLMMYLTLPFAKEEDGYILALSFEALIDDYID